MIIILIDYIIRIKANFFIFLLSTKKITLVTDFFTKFSFCFSFFSEMSRKYKSPVFKSEYMKLLDQDGTKRLETDFNALQNQLESLKAEKKKLSPEKGEGDAETASPSKWGSSNKDEKYKARRLKQQSRKILGKEIDFGSVSSCLPYCR